MSKKAIKYIAALLAIFFCTAAFSISSFAPHIAVISAKGETDGVIPGSKPSSKSVSSEIVSSKIVSSKPVSSSSIQLIYLKILKTLKSLKRHILHASIGILHYLQRGLQQR